MTGVSQAFRIPGKNGWKDETRTWWGRMFTPGTMGWQYWAFDLPYTNSFIRRGSTPGDQGLPPTSSVLRQQVYHSRRSRPECEQINNPIKRHGLPNWLFKKQDSALCCRQHSVMATVYIMVCYRQPQAINWKLGAWRVQERVSVAGTKRRLAARKTVWKES